MKKKPLIPEEYKEKRAELFEIDGHTFTVKYLPKAAMNRLENWVEKLSSGASQAMTMETATELNHTESPCEFADYVTAEEAKKRYVDFIGVCILYTKRELMEEALRSAPKKKDGTLIGKRVQHLAFTGLAVNFDFYELCAVNESSDVMTLEIRSTGCSHRYLPAFHEAKACEEILAEHS